MAGNSAGSIFVDLLLRDAQYRQGLNNSRASTSVWVRTTQNDLNSVSKAFASVLNPVQNVSSAIAGLGSALAAGLSVQKIVQYSDVWRQLSGRLMIVEGSMGGVSDAQEKLFEVAQKTRTPLEGIVNFYTRLNQFVPQAERAQFDLFKVTERVADALAITGETSESASAAMVQFTQAIGTNFQSAGQELRSIQEQAPRLAVALQNALGDGTKSLQQLKNEGKLTRQSVLNALGGMGEEGRKLSEELAKIPLTVGQSFTQLDSAFLRLIGTNKTITTLTSGFASSINFLSKNLDEVVDITTILVSLIGVRLVASFVAANTQTVLYQVALARMAGVSGVAAAGITSLNTALNFFGGPAGIAIFTAVGLIASGLKDAADQQAKYGEAVKVGNDLSKEYIIASKARQQQIKQETDDVIKGFESQLQALQTYVQTSDKLYNESFFGKLKVLSQQGLSFLGLNEKDQPGYSGAQKQIEALNDALKKLKETRDSFGKPNTPLSPAPLSDEELKKLQELYKKHRELILDLSEDTIKYMDIESDLQKLYKNGLITTEQYNEALKRASDSRKNLLATITNQGNGTNAIVDFEKFPKDKVKSYFFDIDKFGSEAANNIQDAFADFFKSSDQGFKGLVKGFADAMQSVISNAAAANLGALLFGDQITTKAGNVSRSGGLIASAGSFLNDFFGGFFADGGNLMPGRWGIVGERGPELIYGGNTGATVIPNGGNGVTNIFNVGGDVSQAQFRRLESMVIQATGPGRTIETVKGAQKRGIIYNA